MTASEQAEAVEAVLQGKIWCDIGEHWAANEVENANLAKHVLPAKCCQDCYDAWAYETELVSFKAWVLHHRARLAQERRTSANLPTDPSQSDSPS